MNMNVSMEVKYSETCLKRTADTDLGPAGEDSYIFYFCKADKSLKRTLLSVP